MLHETVSFLDSTAHHVVLGLDQLGSQHPLTATGLLLLFVMLAAMLCAEVIEARLSSRSHEAPPIRLKR